MSHLSTPILIQQISGYTCLLFKVSWLRTSAMKITSKFTICLQFMLLPATKYRGLPFWRVTQAVLPQFPHHNSKLLL